MGFINDLKKAFFGAKSVVKSAGREAAGQGEELKKKADEWMAEGKEKEQPDTSEPEVKRESPTSEPSDAVEDDLFKFAEEELENSPPVEPGALEKAADRLSEMAERAGKKIEETSEEVGERLLDENREEDPEWLQRAKEKTEDLGDKVLDTGEKAWDKAREMGKGLKGRFDDWVDKANEELEKEKLEETTRKAEKTAEEVADQAKKDTRDGGLLGGHESFFDRAARFAEGDYRGEGDMRIEKSDAPEEEEKKKEEKPGKVKGFEDRDGDGDEIIDDAILDDKD